MGMSGLREMLKALKKTNTPSPPNVFGGLIYSQPRTSLFPHSQITPMPTRQKRRAKTSTGPESIKSGRNQNLPPTLSYTEPALTPKSSPHRASISRIGQKSKVSLATPDLSLDSVSASRSKQSDKDLDRMDAAPDLEHAAIALEDGFRTAKGKKSRSPYLEAAPPSMLSGRPVTSMIDPAASRSSILGGPEPSPPSRTTGLSNVEENVGDDRGSRALRRGPHCLLRVPRYLKVAKT